MLHEHSKALLCRVLYFSYKTEKAVLPGCMPDRAALFRN